MYHPHEYWEARGRTYLYESHEGDEERGRWIETIVKALRPESVLEVGAGPGKYLGKHADAPFRVAIDFSASAIGSIPDRLGCDIANMDAGLMGFRDLTFDLAFTCAVLVHVPDGQIGRAIDEICRVTRGHVLVMEYWDPERVIGELAPHCFRHDYPRMFAANGFYLALDSSKQTFRRRLSALIGLFLFERENP